MRIPALFDHSGGTEILARDQRPLSIGSILLVIADICAADALRHSAQADELQFGIAAYDRGDYATALKILTALAKRCDEYA